MTPEQITSMITAIGTMVTAVGIVVNNIMQKINARKASERGVKTLEKIKEVHDATNGMKTELVNEVRASSTAAGNKAGRMEERAEHPRDPGGIKRP